MKRSTVGEISTKLLSKTPDSRSPIEIERECHKEYEQEVIDCFNAFKKNHSGDFFVVVITKKEPLMENVIRHFFLARVSCPTPDYDQTVYHYDHKKNVLTFEWVVPSKDACLYFLENKQEVTSLEWGLLQNVLRFADGSLFKLSKKFNGEEEDSSLLIT